MKEAEPNVRGGVENAGPENAGPNVRGGKSMNT